MFWQKIDVILDKGVYFLIFVYIVTLTLHAYNTIIITISSVFITCHYFILSTAAFYFINFFRAFCISFLYRNLLLLYHIIIPLERYMVLLVTIIRTCKVIIAKRSNELFLITKTLLYALTKAYFTIIIMTELFTFMST